jgi:catechol 2,3-dioxygenase
VKSTIRSFDLAHLAHLELLTPTPEQSLDFFVNVMGMTETTRKGDSVYLRGWDDYEHHTLKLTASKVAGMGHFAFRASSPEALQNRVGIIERAGFGKGWNDGDLGHGPAYAFTTPDGHNMEVYWETEWYKAPPELKPSLKNQAMRFPAPRCERAAPRSPQSPDLGRRRTAALHGRRPGHADDRDDRARQR